jgi:hypothetical protein
MDLLIYEQVFVCQWQEPSGFSPGGGGSNPGAPSKSVKGLQNQGGWLNEKGFAHTINHLIHPATTPPSG